MTRLCRLLQLGLCIVCIWLLPGFASAQSLRGITSVPEGTPHFQPAGFRHLGSDLPLPVGAWGFRFGLSERQTRAHCARNGGRYRVADESRVCVSVGGRAGFDVALFFCARRLCELSAIAESAQPGLQFRELLQEFTRIYGVAHGKRIRGADAGCALAVEAGDSPPCLWRDASFRLFWVANGSDIELSLERSLGESPQVRVRLRDPNRRREIDLGSNK